MLKSVFRRISRFITKSEIGIENINPDFPIERILFSRCNQAFIEDTNLRLLLETAPPSLQLRALPTELVVP